MIKEVNISLLEARPVIPRSYLDVLRQRSHNPTKSLYRNRISAFTCSRYCQFEFNSHFHALRLKRTIFSFSF